MKRFTKTNWAVVAHAFADEIEIDQESENFICPYCEEPIYSDDFPEIDTDATGEKPIYFCPVCGFEFFD